MASTFDLLFFSIAIYVVGGFLSLLFFKVEKLAVFVSGLFGVIGGGLALYAVYGLLVGNSSVLYHVYQGPFPFTQMPIRLDLFAAFMIGVISLLSIASSLYSFSYVQEYVGKGASSMGFFMNIFIASMISLMLMDNAFYFIIFFELMSLSSYFLVISEQDTEAVKAGHLYFLIAHAGSILIMIAFFIMCYSTPEKSLNFSAFRAISLSPLLSSSVFFLAFFGFGAKAGMVPLHGWLPRAHPAAPSHASAMMSGAMVKIGIFGIIKVAVDLLSGSETQMWWGIVVLGFGAMSAVLGILYALSEHDIKRVLAYCTVENVGIIMMGAGVGIIGLSQRNYVLASLGFLGALYHLLNHAVFKGLLFLGAGSVIYRLHDKNMEKMGGLAKLMPFTAIAFLVGCMAVSALPPLNGFTSEWYTYQALFSLCHEGTILTRLAGPIAIVLLTITGAVAAMCFVKVYGVGFCGSPRSEKVSSVKEVPAPMVFAMLLLALLCLFLGVAAAHVSPVISRIAGTLIASPTILVATQGQLLIPGSATTSFSPYFVMLLMVAATLVPVAIFMIGSSYRLPFRRNTDPWACGYEYEGRMASDSRSFAQVIGFVFAWLYHIRKTLDPAPAMHYMLRSVTSFASKIEPFWDDKILAPVVNTALYIGRKIEVLQQGDFRIYCLYIVTALIIVLLICIL